ncbi:Inner membrane symporter YicJ [Rubripirellula tenax]|uniref:Inner membrane symporter YicJ n=1 Tax=Rubripirellula tenax TaxID=2528015 RepID=A0A5C6EL19_9BACT|nr:glycoside-pentoside-hexuronide (GPH):cation symporter [Rubripirellula tenax]TWU48807.1 Inner membrane symporter YicJ [Rubripirellula tenax]
MSTDSIETKARRSPCVGSDETLSVFEKAGYGLGDMASNFYWKTFEVFLIYFYTDVFGLSAAVAGTMLLVTRVWDAVNDPIIGWIADRTRTRWGRFRPYLIWMSIPFAISGMFAFYTPDLSPNGKIVYAYVSFLLLMTCYAAINIPYGALMGVISANSLERTSVSTYRFVFAFTGGVIVQYFTLDLVAWYGRTSAGEGIAGTVDEQVGFFWTMTTYAVAAMFLFWICFATTRERITGDVIAPSTIRQDVGDLLGNGPWFVLMAFGFLQLLGAFIRGGAILYYFKYLCGDATIASTYLVAGSLASIAGMLLTKKAAKLIGKKRLMMISSLAMAASSASLFWIDVDQLKWIFAIHIIGSFIGGPGPVLLWAMYADVADYSQWKNKRRATGLIFSAATFSQKFGCAIGAAAAGFMLDGFGYAPPIAGVEQAQTPETLRGVRLMISLLPAAFYAASALCLLAYRIDEKTLKQIESDLRQPVI